jgi:hypothetical protein
MLRNFENTGFVPSVAVIDQMQFITPDGYKKDMQGWEKEKLLSSELDELSHKTIGGHKFALWVLHQAKGNRKRRFKEEDVEGYKGITQPSDLVVGIGRDNDSSSECSVFTLKNRHGKEFDVDVETELQYMRFLGTGPLPATQRISAIDLTRNSRGERVQCHLLGAGPVPAAQPMAPGNPLN